MSDVGQYVGGVCVALVSTSCSAVGLALQKSVHKRREAQEKSERRPYYREPRWLGGIGLMLVGSLLSLAVFALLGQSRASAMAAVTIAINAVLSKYFLGEPFTSIDAATTLFICKYCA
jgi:type II secretory pathway pseudopilin PulG